MPSNRPKITFPPAGRPTTIALKAKARPASSGPRYRVHQVKAVARGQFAMTPLIHEDVQEFKLTTGGCFMKLHDGTKGCWDEASKTLKKSGYLVDAAEGGFKNFVHVNEQNEVFQGHMFQGFPDHKTQRVKFPPRTARIIQVVETRDIFIALSETGQVYTWSPFTGKDLTMGRYTNDETRPGLVNLPKIKQICGDSRFAVALSEEGKVYTWGRGSFGVLGHGASGRKGDLDHPCLVQGKGLSDRKVVQVCCGKENVTALTDEGSVFSWGRGDRGQLGTGHSTIITTPHIVKLTVPIRQIACGDFFGMALSEEGQVYAWGTIGGFLLTDTPVRLHYLEDRNVDKIYCSREKIVVMIPRPNGDTSTSSQVSSTENTRTNPSRSIQGDGKRHVRPDISGTERKRQRMFPPTGRVAPLVATSQSTMMASTTTGDNDVSSGMDPKGDHATSPVNKAAPKYRVHQVKAIHLGKLAIAQMMDEDVTDLNVNSRGIFVTLPNGAKRRWNSNDKTLEISQFCKCPSLDAAGCTSVFLEDNGEVFCQRERPLGKYQRKKISFPHGTSKICKVVATGDVAVALSESGQIYTWVMFFGYELSTLGREKGDMFQPALVDLPKITQICGRSGSVVALSKEGRVYTWGKCSNGVLGHGDVCRVGDKDRPCLVQTALTGQTVTQICCGLKHVTVLTDNGRVYSWGKANKGQQGTRYTSCSSKPSEAFLGNASHPIRQIACGDYFGLAVSENGTMFVWGALSGHIISKLPSRITYFDKYEVERMACDGDCITVLVRNPKSDAPTSSVSTLMGNSQKILSVNSQENLSGNAQWNLSENARRNLSGPSHVNVKRKFSGSTSDTEAVRKTLKRITLKSMRESSTLVDAELTDQQRRNLPSERNPRSSPITSKQFSDKQKENPAPVTSTGTNSILAGASESAPSLCPNRNVATVTPQQSKPTAHEGFDEVFAWLKDTLPGLVVGDLSRYATMLVGQGYNSVVLVTEMLDKESLLECLENRQGERLSDKHVHVRYMARQFQKAGLAGFA